MVADFETDSYVSRNGRRIFIARSDYGLFHSRLSHQRKATAEYRFGEPTPAHLRAVRPQYRYCLISLGFPALPVQLNSR